MHIGVQKFVIYTGFGVGAVISSIVSMYYSQQKYREGTDVIIMYAMSSGTSLCMFTTVITTATTLATYAGDVLRNCAINLHNYVQ